MEKKTGDTTETVTFGAGCFWKPQEEFDQVPGVLETTVGYMGGHTEEPTYEQVCTDDTGHAEVTQIVFDPSKVSYEELLRKFWKMHDPTQLNRQGPDVGSQYRSAVFHHSPEQQKIAERVKEELTGEYQEEIVTQIMPADTFTEAEEYHQKYYQK